MTALRYDDFVPGSILGQGQFAFTQAALDQWAALFPNDAKCAPTMPPAMIAMVVSRAYMQAVPQRPPGNIHAAQKFRVTRLPSIDERLTTTVRCIGKEIKNSRRWIVFGTDTRDEAALPLFEGEMRTIWAA